jgi:N-methylhydantoinase B
MRLRVEAEGISTANTAGEGILHGAKGIGGGRDGAPHDYTLLAPDAPPRKFKSKEIAVPIPPGSVLQVLSGGGGGWGDPALRDAAARETDVAEGLA